MTPQKTHRPEVQKPDPMVEQNFALFIDFEFFQ